MSELFGMSKIADSLELKIGEKFNIKEYPEKSPYHFDVLGLRDKFGDYQHKDMADLLAEQLTIEYMPFTPDWQEVYYYISRKGFIYERTNLEETFDIMAMKLGNCFRTKASAKRIDNYARVMKELFGIHVEVPESSIPSEDTPSDGTGDTPSEEGNTPDSGNSGSAEGDAPSTGDDSQGSGDTAGGEAEGDSQGSTAGAGDTGEATSPEGSPEQSEDSPEQSTDQPDEAPKDDTEEEVKP